MPATATTYVHLARKPGSAYRQLFVHDKGRYIFTWTLHDWNQGEDAMSVEELAADFDLPIEAVREAIAYCASNPPEMEADRRCEEIWMEATGMNEPGYKYNPRPKMLSTEEMAEVMRKCESISTTILRQQS